MCHGRGVISIAMATIAKKTTSIKPTLFIVESREIAAMVRPLLGDNYVVRSTEGPIAEVSREPGAVDVENDFAARFELTSSGRLTVSAIKVVMSDARAMVLAMGPTCEGELLASHVVEFVQPTIPVSRVTFHEATKDALMEALANPREIDTNVAAAGCVSQVIDRLYGEAIAPGGRITPLALRLVVERDLERTAVGRSVEKPERYTDETLMTALEELGVGRPSLYALAIAELKDLYIWTPKGEATLVPTLTAFAMWQLLMERFPQVVDFTVARNVETLIDEVGVDASRRGEVLRTVYFGGGDNSVWKTGVRAMHEKLKEPIRPNELYVWELGKHPDTGEPVVIRPGLGRGQESSPYIQCGARSLAIMNHTRLDEWSLSRACELLELAEKNGRLRGR